MAAGTCPVTGPPPAPAALFPKALAVLPSPGRGSHGASGSGHGAATCSIPGDRAVRRHRPCATTATSCGSRYGRMVSCVGRPWQQSAGYVSSTLPGWSRTFPAQLAMVSDSADVLFASAASVTSSASGDRLSRWLLEKSCPQPVRPGGRGAYLPFRPRACRRITASLRQGVMFLRI